MSEPIEDTRNRPLVFQTHASPLQRSRRRPLRVLATILLVIAALGGATGLAFGGSAVWSVVGPKAPDNEPAPLWIPAPTPVGALANEPGDPDHSPSSPGTPSGDHGSGGGGATSGPGPGAGDDGSGRGGGSGPNSGKGSPNSGKGSSGDGGSGSGSGGSGKH